MSAEYEHSDADFSDYNSFSDADNNNHNTLSDAEIDNYRSHERRAYGEAKYEDPAPNANKRPYNDIDNMGRHSPVSL